jgi:hypothetical protein
MEASAVKKKPIRKAEKRSVGRPSVYRKAYVEQAFRLALLGQTDGEMASFFKVAESTFHLWKLRHPEFSESISRGKEDADSKVAASLYQAALGGGTITETRVQEDSKGSIVRTTETKELPASVQAMCHWLKNRQPSKWRDSAEVDVTLRSPSNEELNHIYEEKMRLARERQAAILAERGLLNDTADE